VEGTIYATKRDPARAAEAFAKAFERQQSSQLARQLAETLHQGGKSEEAATVLKGWIKEHPDDYAAQAMLGLFYQQLGRPKDAIVAYESVADKSPEKDPLLLNNLAWLYLQGGDARAEKVAKQAFDLAPSRPEVADTYGWVLYKSGKKEQGLSILQQAYLAFPTQSEIGYHVAVALDDLGRQDESIQILRKILRSDTTSEHAESAKKLLKKLGG
jgi:tetratricopeptide (TPR) repeat protein